MIPTPRRRASATGMGIKGDVRSISLANVLQDLVTNEQTGTLAIRHKKDRQALYLWFEKGALKLVGLGNGQGPSLLNGDRKSVV